MQDGEEAMTLRLGAHSTLAPWSEFPPGRDAGLTGSEGVSFHCQHQISRHQAYSLCYWHCYFLQVSIQTKY